MRIVIAILVLLSVGAGPDEAPAQEPRCGSGYFSSCLAASLPRGSVVAIDIEPEMIRHVHHKVLGENLSNIEAVLATGDDLGVPADADLVLVEFKEGDLPNGPPASLEISRERMIELATSAGLSLQSEMSGLLPYQTFLVFERAR